MQIVLIVLVALVVIYILRGIKIVSQSETMIVERLGKYNRTLNAGINVILPIIEQAKETIVRRQNGALARTSRIDMREQVYDFDKQSVITKDNVMTEINALLYFQIVDPMKAVYEIQNLPVAIEKLTQTTLRNVVGEMELDETLTSRDTINSKLRNVLDDATNKWGVKVNRVELQDITPPESIRRTMELQMQAERNRRAEILKAEGEKQAQILNSEGEKRSPCQGAASRSRSCRHPQHCRSRLRPWCRPRKLLAGCEVYRDPERGRERTREQNRLSALRSHQCAGLAGRHKGFVREIIAAWSPIRRTCTSVT